MRIGVPAETFAGEKRVATVPEVVEKLVKLGFQVSVQSGAGEGAAETRRERPPPRHASRTGHPRTTCTR